MSNAASWLLLSTAAAVLAACGGGGGDAGGGAPPAPSVARVVVTPSIGSVDVGKTVALTAQALDASGAALNRTFTWSSSDTTRATVDANGVVTGVAAGAVSITATADAVTSAPAALTVRTPVVVTQSSVELIDAALASGALDAETGLTYKVFAAFGDTRLPAAYQGNDADVVDTDAVDLVKEAWPTLSDATKQTVAPFLMPPVYTGSWATLPTAHAARATGSYTAAAPTPSPKSALVKTQLNLPICKLNVDPNWQAVSTASAGRVKVWYDTRFADGARQADLIRNELETKIWPTLVDTVGMKAPLSDAALTGCNGGDGRLDVFVVSMALAGATASDLGETFPAQWATSQSPAYIILNRNLIDEKLKAVAAHEFMHASQWAYPVAASLSSYKWLKEATAQSAIDVVYATNQLEQVMAPAYMATPDENLDNQSISSSRTYGSYLFFQFLNRTLGPTTLASIWNATTTQSNQALAVDSGISGGFKEQWPKFAKLLWNQDPVNTNSFEGWDSLTLTPALRGGQPLSIGLGTQRLQGNIKHLASHYYQFKIADPNVRSLSFFNHLQAFFPSANPQVVTQAFIKKQGGIWQYEHWSDQAVDVDGVKSYCLDLIAERVTDLVIVMSNRDPQVDITGVADLQQPRISASNVGCWRYKGSASVSTSGSNAVWPQFTQSADASVTLERYRTPQVPSGVPGQEKFAVLTGAITGRVNATTAAGCTLTQTSNDNMTPGLASGSLNVMLGLDIGANTSPRDVTGSGSASGMTHTVIKCPNIPDTTSDGPTDWDWLDLPAPAEMKVEVLPDGTIVSSQPFTRTLTNGTQGTQTVIWNFVPQRQ